MRPSGLCRSQNYEIRAGADDTQSSRHILKVGIQFQITGIPKGWEDRGGMITRITFKQRISGAMKKKDRPEWMIKSCAYAFAQRRKRSTRTDLRPISRTLSRRHVEPNHSSWLCASCVPDFRFRHSPGGTQAHPDHE